MSHLKITLVLVLLVAATTTACCCPLGSLLGEAEFTEGDFTDVPAYPGASQTTESNTAINLMVTPISLVAEDVEWKHYTTDDAEGEILSWYQDRLPNRGWSEATAEDLGNVETEGVLIFSKDDEPDTLLVVMAVSGLEEGDSATHILIGRMTVSQ